MKQFIHVIRQTVQILLTNFEYVILVYRYSKFVYAFESDIYLYARSFALHSSDVDSHTAGLDLPNLPPCAKSLLIHGRHLTSAGIYRSPTTSCLLAESFNLLPRYSLRE